MNNQYLETGKIVSTHGIRGEVKVQPWADSPDFLLRFKTLYLDRGARPMAVEQARVQKTMVLLKLKGIDTVEQAQAMRDQILYLDRVPDSAAVNEAVELGKTYDSPQAGAFLNGLLGSFLREEKPAPET